MTEILRTSYAQCMNNVPISVNMQYVQVSFHFLDLKVRIVIVTDA